VAREGEGNGAEVKEVKEEEEAGPPQDVGKTNGERTWEIERKRGREKERRNGKTGRINKYFIRFP